MYVGRIQDFTPASCGNPRPTAVTSNGDQPARVDQAPTILLPDQRLRGLRLVDSHPRPHAQEGHDRQSSSVPRRAAGGQHVVRACAVVAEHLCGPSSDEESAVVKATEKSKFEHGRCGETDREIEQRWGQSKKTYHHLLAAIKMPLPIA